MENTTKNIFIGAVSGAVAAILVFGVGTAYGNLNSQVEGKNNQETLAEQLEGKKFVSEQELVISAVKKAEPAVVSIIITKDVPIIEKYYERPGNDPFGDFFGFPFGVPQYRQKGTEEREVGGGSGFVVSEDGYVVTNRHVVEEDPNAQYTVFTSDDKEYAAKVLARDPLNDIAVLKIEAEDLPYLEFGDSEDLNLGQSVIAIGNPLLEFTNSVSKGVISGLARSIVAGDMSGRSEQLEGVIQTDAAINPGNSGGPLIDLTGKVIGMNVAVASAENIGFSLPGNTVRKVVESVRENGEIVRPYLGVRYVPVTEALKKANNLEVDYGIVISKGTTPEELAVLPGSPADKAGLEENDIVLEIDGKKVDKENSLARMIANKNVGQEVVLTVLSNGKEKKVKVKLEKMPTNDSEESTNAQ